MECIFLPDQVAEYDQVRLLAQQVRQLQFFVSDEYSAILWLRQFLEQSPKSYQNIFTDFIQELQYWQINEKHLELSELLEQNFLRYDGTGSIPEKIWVWMQQDETIRELIKGQDRINPAPYLQSIAKDRWYVPDPNRAQDLEKLRERALLKEFDEYLIISGRSLKIFRLEALRAGFKHAWENNKYDIIIRIAEKIPEEILQEDTKLLMWYDQAITRRGEIKRIK